MDDLEQKLKEKLLEGLIEHMQGKMGDDLESKFPKKSLDVAVLSPDKGPEPEPSSDDEGSDEDRLMALLGEDKDDEDDIKGH